jgi:hypothetical protein
VIVTLRTNVFCPSCSAPIRFLGVATVRVNKRSMHTVGGGIMIGGFEDHRCPACGEEIPRDRPLDREPYRLSDEDAVKVAEYRKRRWGIEASGEAVERVAG